MGEKCDYLYNTGFQARLGRTNCQAGNYYCVYTPWGNDDSGAYYRVYSNTGDFYNVA